MSLREIGLVPAAGAGTRLWPYRSAKELIPIGYAPSSTAPDSIRPKAVSEYTLDLMRTAEVELCYLIVSDQKAEVMRHYGNGAEFGIHIAYLHQRKPAGLPKAIDSAYPWLRDSMIMLGLPDTIVYPQTAFADLKQRFYQDELDLILGVFPTDHPELLGPVRLNEQGQVLEVQDKPPQTDLRNAWAIVAWGPAFTDFLHDQLQAVPADAQEEPIGKYFQAALENNLKVGGILFPEGTFVDIGTPKGMIQAKQLVEAEWHQAL